MTDELREEYRAAVDEICDASSAYSRRKAKARLDAAVRVYGAACVGRAIDRLDYEGKQ